MAGYHGDHHEYRSPFGDTTYTKVFVGGLAWETHTDKMRTYFEQFGDILEAVIITENNTGKSKGYGFVTFRDPAAAARACINANPLIDGRRANCNIASFSRPRPSPPRGSRNEGGVQGQASSTSYSGVPTPQQAFPAPYYYPYGYPYTAYNYQGLYNQQLQQSQQYYAQIYGLSSPASSVGGASYYHGGYSLANTRPGFSSSTPGDGITSPYVYYPMQLQGPPYSYLPIPYPALLPSAPALHRPSSTEESQAEQRASVEKDTTAIHPDPEGPNT